MTNDHSDRTHAALGGSTAERWLNCPGSVFYIRDLPKEIPSEAALEGTKAHEYAEVILEGFLSYKLDGVPQDPLLVLNDELFTLGETYKDLVWKNVLQESITDKSYALEDKLVLDKHLEMFGFVDFWAIYIDDHGKKTGVIVDFKSGYTEITVKNNAQLAFYACALREEIVRKGKDLDRVRAIIIQPKVHEPYKEVNFTAKQLDVWRTKFFKAAEQIFVKKKATFKVGSWCKFCPAQSICSVYAKKLQSELSLKLIEPDEELLPLPDKLTNEQLIAVVSKEDKLIEFIKECKKYIFNKIDSGDKSYPFKIVEGVSRRKWQENQTKIGLALTKAGLTDVYRTELRTITEIEKMLSDEHGKDDAKNIVSKYCEMTTPNKILVPIDDKRESVKTKLDYLKN